MTHSTVEKPLNTKLTIGKIKQGAKNKRFYSKNRDIIFPMNGKFAVAIAGLYDGETMPLLDEVRTANLLRLLGNHGWNECYFEKK